MLVRRKKVLELVTDIRGGAIHVPSRVLDCLLEPTKALGLEEDIDAKNSAAKESNTLAKWIAILSGF